MVARWQFRVAQNKTLSVESVASRPTFDHTKSVIQSLFNSILVSDARGLSRHLFSHPCGATPRRLPCFSLVTCSLVTHQLGVSVKTRLGRAHWPPSLDRDPELVSVDQACPKVVRKRRWPSRFGNQKRRRRIGIETGKESERRPNCAHPTTKSSRCVLNTR